MPALVAAAESADRIADDARRYQLSRFVPYQFSPATIASELRAMHDSAAEGSIASAADRASRIEVLCSQARMASLQEHQGR